MGPHTTRTQLNKNTGYNRTIALPLRKTSRPARRVIPTRRGRNHPIFGRPNARAPNAIGQAKRMIVQYPAKRLAYDFAPLSHRGFRRFTAAGKKIAHVQSHKKRLHRTKWFSAVRSLRSTSLISGFRQRSIVASRTHVAEHCSGDPANPSTPPR